MNFTVQSREKTGKGFNRRLRVSGKTPGVIYGINEPQPVAMDEHKAMRLINSLKGANKVISLTVESDGKAEEKQVLLQDYQMSNWGQKLIHADFLEVSDKTRVTVEVPINVINEEICPAVESGGVIQVIRRSIPVKCLANRIPGLIEIDIKDLEFGGNIHVLDLDYPEGVTPIVKGRNFTVITVAGRVADEVEEAGEEAEADAEEPSKAEGAPAE
ncbi:50S ribosomal protein L25 [bacterium]|nr:50S ribosomal protein L25 [bacterium]